MARTATTTAIAIPNAAPTQMKDFRIVALPHHLRSA
jgi:hypothetical protein